MHNTAKPTLTFEGTNWKSVSVKRIFWDPILLFAQALPFGIEPSVDARADHLGRVQVERVEKQYARKLLFSEIDIIDVVLGFRGIHVPDFSRIYQNTQRPVSGPVDWYKNKFLGEDVNLLFGCPIRHGFGTKLLQSCKKMRRKEVQVRS